MTFSKAFLLLSLLLTFQAKAQDSIKSRKSMIVPVKVDGSVFDKIFGEHCPDTVIHPINKKIIYVLKKESSSRSSKRLIQTIIIDASGQKKVSKLTYYPNGLLKKEGYYRYIFTYRP